jgi:hypothetical protein
MQRASRSRRGQTAVVVALLLLAGTLAHLPALRSPPLLDDYMHVSMIEGTFCGRRGPFDLYDFVNEADRSVLLERGLLPWWSHPRLTIRFFRPLASALRWTEQRAFGSKHLLFHLHSLAWWAAAVVAAFLLYRRVLTRRVALLATGILALAPCHVFPLGWLANREVLLSLTFGTVGLGAYVRWRTDGRWLHAACASGLFAFALLAGEYALGFAGYVLAIELGQRGERPWRRALASLPFVAPTAAYLGVRAWLGYGTFGSAFYIDPLREPLSFLRVAPGRLLRLLAEEWLTVGTSAWSQGRRFWLLFALVGGGLALAVVPLRRMSAALPDESRRTARWLLLGSLLALVPVLAVVASPRVLGISMLGVAAVVALLLEHAWFGQAAEPGRGRELTRTVAVALGFAHLVHSPVTSWIASRELLRGTVAFAESAAELGARLRDRGGTGVIVLRGFGSAEFGPFALEPRGAAPGRWRILSQGNHVLVLRKDARTLELAAPLGETVFPTGRGNLYRNETRPFRVGAQVALGGMTVTVLEVTAKGPRRIRVTFDHDLDESPYLWVHEARDGFRDATLPLTGFGAPFDP